MPDTHEHFANTEIPLRVGTLAAVVASEFLRYTGVGKLVEGRTPAEVAAVIDHGLLIGLGDNDHSQYPLKSILTTKGDIYVATAAGVLVRLGVGADAQVLTADAAEATGIKWAAGGGAPDDAQYLVLALDGELSSERKLTPGTAMTFADGGANGNLVVSHSTVSGDNLHTEYTKKSILTARGSMYVASGVSTPVELAVGASARIIQSDGSDPLWVVLSGDATIAAGGAVTVAGTHSGSAHHNEGHIAASHSDQGATGAELETLTDTSDADALHTHPAHAAAGDPHTGYRLESADHSHESAGAQAGQLSLTAAVTGVLPEVNLPDASKTAQGVVELANTAEIDAGTDTERAMPVDQFVASKRNIRYLTFVLVDKDTDVAVATSIGGDFRMPFAGTILQDDADKTQLMAYTDAAGSGGGPMVVDIHLNGATIMTTNKLDIETGEKTTEDAATQPDLTTTSFNKGDIFTFDVDAKHTTEAKGLKVQIAVRE